MLQLTFNPGLTLTGFRTTQPSDAFIEEGRVASVPWTNILVARQGYWDENVFKYARVFLKKQPEADYGFFSQISKIKMTLLFKLDLETFSNKTIGNTSHWILCNTPRFFVNL